MLNKKCTASAVHFFAEKFKFQFIVLFESTQLGNYHHCHCEERIAAAISW